MYTVDYATNRELWGSHLTFYQTFCSERNAHNRLRGRYLTFYQTFCSEINSTLNRLYYRTGTTVATVHELESHTALDVPGSFTRRLCLSSRQVSRSSSVLFSFFRHQ